MVVVARNEGRYPAKVLDRELRYWIKRQRNAAGPVPGKAKNSAQLHSQPTQLKAPFPNLKPTKMPTIA